MGNEASTQPEIRARFHELDGKTWAQVQVCNPSRLNAMTVQMWRDLKTVFRNLQAREEVRCIVFSGEGGNFCSGGDISEYATFRFGEDSLRRFHEDDVLGGLQAMLDCDVPIIAAIEGVCMGAGVEMACCCDIRIATPQSRFGAPIARLGFPMAPHEARIVTQAIGDSIARRMLLAAAVLDAGELRAAGFLAELVEAENLQACLGKKLQTMLALAPAAARMNKQTLRALRQGRLEQMLPGAYVYAPTREHREGIDAFVQKRRPVF